MDKQNQKPLGQDADTRGDKVLGGTNLCIFGASGSGKSCFIYAMAQVLGSAGAKGGDMRFSLRANSKQQQAILNSGYMSLLDDKWPEGTTDTTTYDLSLRLHKGNNHLDAIPHLLVTDYRGGVMDPFTTDEDDLVEYEMLLETFSDAAALVFIIGSDTILDVLSKDDLDISHRNRKVTVKDHEIARQKIGIIENLLLDYKRDHKTLPPILVALSKDDILTPEEMEAGKEYIMNALPSVFEPGCDVVSAFTHFSLGEDLSGEKISDGKLMLTTERNLHIPVLFGAYQVLSNAYFANKTSGGDKELIVDMLSSLRVIFRNRIEIFLNGQKAKEI